SPTEPVVSAVPSTASQQEAVTSTDEPGPAGGRAGVATQPDEELHSVEPSRSVPPTSNAVAKTWATMAATSSTKRGSQNTEQKSTTGVTVPRPKGSGSPSIPWKDVTKPQQGIYFSALSHN